MDRRTAALWTGAALLSACERPTEVPQSNATSAPLPTMVVYKNQGCACCDLWVEHLRKAGFVAQVHEMSNMGPIKDRVGVPVAMGSCHTADVGGYFLEGHVPAEAVLRLLRERPAAKGLTVPGMPLGSPGMEVEGRNDPYDVFLVAVDGSTSVYAHHGGEA